MMRLDAHMFRRLALFATVLAVVASVPTISAEKTKLPKTAYLFSYFINNGEDGLHLAWSVDGLNWTALNGGKSYIRPEVGESKLMRDPCLVLCPDGMFRMVWTTSWGGQTIGYASSKDLITWSPQQAIPVGAADKTDNCWAPELFYDSATKYYIIIWSSTVPDRFPVKPEEAGDGNHRTYYTRTKDFKTFEPTKLFFNPGFNCIDPTMVKANGKYHLIFKDERPKPVWQKNLRTAEGPTATGPWTNISEPFSRHGVEGPSVLKMGDYYVCYFDGFAGGGYGAMKTKDFVKWEEQSTKLVVPPGTKHGAALAVPGKVIEKLLSAEPRAELTYKLSGGSDNWPPAARKRITDAMDGAVALYNQNGVFLKSVTANYSPGTPTADANYNGWINFGGSISRRVALHELSHTLGVGQHRNWQKLIKEGKWTGEHALAQLRAFDGPNAVLHADRMHFWPYGLNYDRESSPESDVRHVKMVAALRQDMGIAR